MTTTYAYYPGCSLHSTAAEYDMSFRAVCDVLEVDLREVKGWICCGTSPAHSTSRLLSHALPMKNLSLAEQMGLTEVTAPCAACFARLRTSLYEAKRDPELHRQLQAVVDGPIPELVSVIHPLEILGALGPEIAEATTHDLSELAVVCYYGCLLTRPPKVMQFDECETPSSMDRLLGFLGIRTLDWSCKTDCCGGALAMTETDIMLKLTHDILEEARGVGADAIAVACPLCQANLDARQAEVEERYETRYGLPVLYFTQLMGLAFGISPKRLGLHKHLVGVDAVLESVAPVTEPARGAAYG
ncbi:MAG: CoB--CoM heterodisulfide reductase iron-sulfur subunit B family protein [Gemmatimonadales bacterium]|nr:CoB--CoM heterodisulfide reductase iron-sulfur subunit B family protein [Gemmatimonadales bacterium]